MTFKLYIDVVKANYGHRKLANVFKILNKKFNFSVT